MTIHEIENKNIQPKGLRMNTDQKIEVPDPLPQLPSFVVAVGKPRSGKSTVLFNMLLDKNGYYQQFDAVFVISPSLVTIKRKLNLNETRVYQDYNKENLENIYEQIMELEENDRALIILDDVVASLKDKNAMPLLQKMIWNRRHLIPGGHVSIWITSQKYRQIPYQIRVAFTHLIIFRVSNTEMEAIIEELSPIGKKEFMEICEYVYQKPHDFLFMAIENPIDSIFYRNFNKLVVNKNLSINNNGQEKQEEKASSQEKTNTATKTEPSS